MDCNNISENIHNKSNTFSDISLDKITFRGMKSSKAQTNSRLIIIQEDCEEENSDSSKGVSDDYKKQSGCKSDFISKKGKVYLEETNESDISKTKNNKQTNLKNKDNSQANELNRDIVQTKIQEPEEKTIDSCYIGSKKKHKVKHKISDEVNLNVKENPYFSDDRKTEKVLRYKSNNEYLPTKKLNKKSKKTNNHINETDSKAQIDELPIQYIHKDKITEPLNEVKTTEHRDVNPRKDHKTVHKISDQHSSTSSSNELLDDINLSNRIKNTVNYDTLDCPSMGEKKQRHKRKPNCGIMSHTKHESTNNQDNPNNSIFKSQEPEESDIFQSSVNRSKKKQMDKYKVMDKINVHDAEDINLNESKNVRKEESHDIDILQFTSIKSKNKKFKRRHDLADENIKNVEMTELLSQHNDNNKVTELVNDVDTTEHHDISPRNKHKKKDKIMGQNSLSTSSKELVNDRNLLNKTKNSVNDDTLDCPNMGEKKQKHKRKLNCSTISETKHESTNKQDNLNNSIVKTQEPEESYIFQPSVNSTEKKQKHKYKALDKIIVRGTEAVVLNESKNVRKEESHETGSLQFASNINKNKKLKSRHTLANENSTNNEIAELLSKHNDNDKGTEPVKEVETTEHHDISPRNKHKKKHKIRGENSLSTLSNELLNYSILLNKTKNSVNDDTLDCPDMDEKKQIRKRKLNCDIMSKTKHEITNKQNNLNNSIVKNKEPEESDIFQHSINRSKKKKKDKYKVMDQNNDYDTEDINLNESKNMRKEESHKKDILLFATNINKNKKLKKKQKKTADENSINYQIDKLLSQYNDDKGTEPVDQVETTEHQDISPRKKHKKKHKVSGENSVSTLRHELLNNIDLLNKLKNPVNDNTLELLSQDDHENKRKELVNEVEKTEIQANSRKKSKKKHKLASENFLRISGNELVDSNKQEDDENTINMGKIEPLHHISKDEKSSNDMLYSLIKKNNTVFELCSPNSKKGDSKPLNVINKEDSNVDNHYKDKELLSTKDAEREKCSTNKKRKPSHKKKVYTKNKDDLDEIRMMLIKDALNNVKGIKSLPSNISSLRQSNTKQEHVTFLDNKSKTCSNTLVRTNENKKNGKSIKNYVEKKKSKREKMCDINVSTNLMLSKALEKASTSAKVDLPEKKVKNRITSSENLPSKSNNLPTPLKISTTDIHPKHNRKSHSPMHAKKGIEKIQQALLSAALKDLNKPVENLKTHNEMRKSKIMDINLQREQETKGKRFKKKNNAIMLDNKKHKTKSSKKIKALDSLEAFTSRLLSAALENKQKKDL